MSTESKQSHFDEVEARLKSIDAPDLLLQSFSRQYAQLVQGASGIIDNSMMDTVADLPRLTDLISFASAGEKALSQTVILKLNGGLGTGMGLDGPKSMLPVKQGLSFLEIAARQIMQLRKQHGTSTPILLMNSFSTHDTTVRAMSSFKEFLHGQRPISPYFVQHRVPKISASDLRPAHWPQAPEKEWCPPGHGDIYLALATSGQLDALLENGYTYAFVSNADNLGATLDLSILGYFADRSIPFMMEAADRTKADRKGGHLARKKDGQLLVRESAQCPASEEDEFQDITKYKYFNTNNIWINLEQLKAKMDSDGPLNLPLIVNRKNVAPADKSSPSVYQLETAMVAAISVFEGSEAIQVPRTRFAPVKTTDDLLVLRSDAYQLTAAHHVILNDACSHAPVVHLDPAYYRMLGDFEARFPQGAPSLIECESLHVDGDIQFGRDVQVKGAIHLKNDADEQTAIADGTVLASSPDS